jgi:hypothetical protein
MNTDSIRASHHLGLSMSSPSVLIRVHPWSTFPKVLGCVLLFASWFLLACAAEPLPLTPETLLADPANDPAWRDLFAKLAPNKTRQSKFEERRFFPFRKEPVVLTGEVRIVPDLGLSLRYLTPDKNTLIADAKGLLLRDDQGRERTPPNDSRAQAATSALVRVLRFDLAALQKDFAVHGRRDGTAWTLAFVARDPAFTAMLGTLTIRGEGGELRAIELVKSPAQRIEIAIRDSVEDVLFTGDTLKRFFR